MIDRKKVEDAVEGLSVRSDLYTYHLIDLARLYLSGKLVEPMGEDEMEKWIIDHNCTSACDKTFDECKDAECKEDIKEACGDLAKFLVRKMEEK